MTATEEDIVRMLPVGYRHLMLLTAYSKRVLSTVKMSDRERLEILERLNGLTDGYFTAAMLATIEPMSDLEVQIMHEARTLDPDGDKLGGASFSVLTGERVFGHLVEINPSILDAIRIREATATAD